LGRGGWNDGAASPEITLHVYHNSDARQLWQLPAIDDFVRRIAGLTTIIYAAFTDQA
jgi:hypothetical protein